MYIHGNERVLTGRAWQFAVLVSVFSVPVSAGTAAVTAVVQFRASDTGKVKAYQGRLAEWTDPGSRVEGARLVHPDADPYGCRQLERCPGCALLVIQGHCPFSQKAKRAEDAGAKLLLVAATQGPALGMTAAVPSHSWSRTPRIPAAMISHADGQRVLSALEKGKSFKVNCWQHSGFYEDMLSEGLVAVLAVSLIILGAWQSVEDMRKPQHEQIEEVFTVENTSGLHFVLFGSLMLTVLFFFMKYLIYVLLLAFASGAISTTWTLFEPGLAACFPGLRDRKAFSLPKRLANWVGVPEDHSCSDAIAAGAGSVLAVAFVLFRNDDAFGWLLQDLIAGMLLMTIQRTMRLPNLRVATSLLVCTFFFDIFWVFLSPMIFKKSVMIEVATGGGTGQSVPMVLKIPALSSDFPGQFKILGLGDIALPGLLISLLLRHDLAQRASWCGGYFVAGVVGYTLGLGATFASLHLMQHGQPALLFLVPGTLMPTVVIALQRGELGAFWGASYGAESGEGYVPLPGNDGKFA